MSEQVLILASVQQVIQYVGYCQTDQKVNVHSCLCCAVHCSQYNLTVSAKVSKHLVETTLKALADITKKLVGGGRGGVSWPCVGGAGGG